MQGKHVVVSARQDFVASLDNQFISRVIQSPARTVGGRGSLLQDRIARDHFAGNQIRANAEMLQRALGLCSPQLVCRNLDHAEAVTFLPEVGHELSPCLWSV